MFPVRFRSTERDYRADRSRIDRVRAVLAAVLGEARAEMAGLERRIQETRVSAGFLCDPDLQAQGSAPNERSRAVSTLENHLVRAEQRRNELMSHIQALERQSVALEALSQSSVSSTASSL